MHFKGMCVIVWPWWGDGISNGGLGTCTRRSVTLSSKCVKSGRKQSASGLQSGARCAKSYLEMLECVHRYTAHRASGTVPLRRFDICADILLQPSALDRRLAPVPKEATSSVGVHLALSGVASALVGTSESACSHTRRGLGRTVPVVPRETVPPH